MTFSKARILAFLHPVISVVSGALAAWLLVHVHFLGIFHVTYGQAATVIASGTVFVVVTVFTWLALHQHLVPISASLRRGMGMPIVPFTPKQIVALAMPYISALAGALTTWLFVHVHLLGDFHLVPGKVAQTVASAIVFTLMTVLTWLAAQYHIMPMLYLPPAHPAGGPVAEGEPFPTVKSTSAATGTAHWTSNP